MRLRPQRTPFNRSLGRRGEMAAERYLRRQGYKILERNYRCKIGEIDLIAQKDGRLIFIEVKTRRSSHYGLPEESVHPLKQKKIVRAAEWYLKENHATDRAVSFEVAAVDWPDGEEPEVRVIRNAFYLDEA